VNEKRNRGVDLIKTVAILGVITVHLSANTVIYGAIGTAEWVIALLWRCLSGACVPLFFMCTGALFLTEEKTFSIKKLYSKNIVRLICAMLFWAMAYKVWNLLSANDLTVSSFMNALLQVIRFEQQPHLYFIHIMLLAYALLPVLKVFVTKAEKRHLVYALAVWFVLGILAQDIRHYFTLGGIPAQWPLNMAWSSLGYILLGHYLSRYGLKKGVAALMGAAGFCVMFFGTAFLAFAKGSSTDRFLSGMGTGACLLGAGAFALLYKSAQSLGEKASRFCTCVSKASFCAYTSHMFIVYIYIYIGRKPSRIAPYANRKRCDTGPVSYFA